MVFVCGDGLGLPCPSCPSGFSPPSRREKSSSSPMLASHSEKVTLRQPPLGRVRWAATDAERRTARHALATCAMHDHGVVVAGGLSGPQQPESRRERDSSSVHPVVRRSGASSASRKSEPQLWYDSRASLVHASAGSCHLMQPACS